MMKKIQQTLLLLATALVSCAPNTEKTETIDPDRHDLVKFNLNGRVQTVELHTNDAKITDGKLTLGKEQYVSDFEVWGIGAKAEFDKAGRLTTATSYDESGKEYELYNREYDEQGALQHSIDITYYGAMVGYNTIYTQAIEEGVYHYDDQNRLQCDTIFKGTDRKEISFRNEYLYNDKNQLAEVQTYSPKNGTDTYDYVKHEYTEDGLIAKNINGRLYKGSNDPELIEQFKYDTEGRQVEKLTIVPHSNEVQVTETKTYNEAGQLVETYVADNSGGGSTKKTCTYTYDANNKLSEVAVQQSYINDSKELYLPQGGIDQLIATEDFNINNYASINEVDEQGNLTKKLYSFYGNLRVETRAYTYR